MINSNFLVAMTNADEILIANSKVELYETLNELNRKSKIRLKTNVNEIATFATEQNNEQIITQDGEIEKIMNSVNIYDKN